jgi:hypothetical protein
MMELFTAAGSAPFTVALVIMLGLAVIELVALLTGFGLNGLVDDFVDVPSADSSAPAEAAAEAPGAWGRFLAWLQVGKLPMLVVLIVCLTVFGLVGLVVQALARSVLGGAIHPALLGPIVAVGCLPLVRACTTILARISPRDETSAVDPTTFVGTIAVVVGGTARAGHPAQARLTDSFGTTHYVLVEPAEADQQLATGTSVLLVDKLDGGRFSAVADPSRVLPDGNTR